MSSASHTSRSASNSVARGVISLTVSVVAPRVCLHRGEYFNLYYSRYGYLETRKISCFGQDSH